MNRSRTLDAVEEILIYALTVAARQMPGVKVRPAAVQSAVSEFRRHRCAALSDAELAAMLKTPEQLSGMFALCTVAGCLTETAGRKTLR